MVTPGAVLRKGALSGPFREFRPDERGPEAPPVTADPAPAPAPAWLSSCSAAGSGCAPETRGAVCCRRSCSPAPRSRGSCAVAAPATWSRADCRRHPSPTVAPSRSAAETGSSSPDSAVSRPVVPPSRQRSQRRRGSRASVSLRCGVREQMTSGRAGHALDPRAVTQPGDRILGRPVPHVGAPCPPRRRGGPSQRRAAHPGLVGVREEADTLHPALRNQHLRQSTPGLDEAALDIGGHPPAVDRPVAGHQAAPRPFLTAAGCSLTIRRSWSRAAAIALCPASVHAGSGASGVAAVTLIRAASRYGTHPTVISCPCSACSPGGWPGWWLRARPPPPLGGAAQPAAGPAARTGRGPDSAGINRTIDLEWPVFLPCLTTTCRPSAATRPIIVSYRT